MSLYALYVAAGDTGTGHQAQSPRFTDFTPNEPLWLSYHVKANRVSGSQPLTLHAHINWYNSAGTALTPTLNDISIDGSIPETLKQWKVFPPTGAVSGAVEITVEPTASPMQHDIWITKLRLGKTALSADVTAFNTAVGDKNRVAFSLVELGTTGYGNLYKNPGTLAVSFAPAFDAASGKNYVAIGGNFTGAGQSASIGTDVNTPAFRIPVRGGSAPERIFVGAKIGVAIPAGGSWQMVVQFLDAAGANLNLQSVDSDTVGIGFPHEIGRFVTVPSAAATAWLELYINSGTAASGAFGAWLSEPIVCSAGVDQTVWPAFNAGPSNEPGASIEANIVCPNPIDILASNTGVPKAGQLRSISVKLMRLGVPVTSGVTWGVSTLSGNVTYTASGSGTLDLALTGPTNNTLATESVLRITGLYQGVTRTLDVKVRRVDDPPTNAGSSGGSGTNPGTTANTTSFDIVTQTSPSSNVSATVTAKAGTAGRVDCTFPAAFYRNPGLTNGITSLTGKIQWRVPAGTFADLPAGATPAYQDAQTTKFSGEPADNEPGGISITDALTGKTPGDTFEFRILFWKTNVNGNVNDVVPSGVFQCAGS